MTDWRAVREGCSTEVCPRSQEKERSWIEVAFDYNQYTNQYNRSRVMSSENRSILSGIFWMAFLSVLLFWLPAAGPVIAGVVGGQKAGGVFSGIVASLLPSVLLGVLVFVFGGTLTGIPLLGIIAGAGVVVFGLAHVGPLLLGAVVGGALA